MKVDGSVAIVTGGARGIGRGYVEALLEKGAKVCVADFLQEEGEALIKELSQKNKENSVIFVRCDVREETDIKAVFTKTLETFGKLDIFVNNAGVIAEDDWERCINTNLKGTIRGTMLALEKLSKAKGGPGGVIINTASISGLRPERWGPVYSATKFGVVGFTRAYADPSHFEMTGVRLNCICPTTVDTPFVNHVRPGRVHFAEQIAEGLASFKANWIKVSVVAAELIKLIEDDSKNGEAVTITHENGAQCTEFPVFPIQ